MRNLLDFIAKYHAFIIFILLELVCFTLIARYNHFQRTSILNSANAVSGGMYNRANEFKEYIYLKDVNEGLTNQNARLQSELNTLRKQLDDQFLEKSLNLEEYCPDDSTTQTYFLKNTPLLYKFRGAKVTNRTTLKPNNYITINKGSKHGIKKEMGIVGQNGIVGVVKDVSPNYSTVISLLHKSMRVGAKIERNNHTGSLRWDGADPQFAILGEIPKHVRVRRGDKIVTSGFSSIFPTDIMIGQIEEVSLAEGSNFFEIKVKLSTNFNSLWYVYAVDYAKKDEQKALEERSQDE